MVLPSIYVSKDTKQSLKQFIERSRVSYEFGAKKKYPNPNKTIEFLLKIGLKYPLTYLENLVSLPHIQGEMPEPLFDNEELRNKIILKELDEQNENEESEDNRD